MSAGGGAYPIVPPLPEFERRQSTTSATSGTDTTTKPVTPREEAAQTELGKRTDEEIAFTEVQRAQKAKGAEVEKQNAEAALFVEQGIEALRTGPGAQKAQEYIDFARARLRSENDRLDKMPAPALFADRDGWGKIRLGIGMAMAGLGDGMMAAAAIRAGHAPMRGNTVQQIIENDLNRQREAINKQKDTVVRARTGLDDAQEARRALLADVELKGKSMYRQVELLTRQRLAGLKLDQAQIDQTKEILELQRAQREQEAAFAGHHGTTVTKRFDSAKTTNETINRSPAAGGEAGKIPGQQAALARQALAEFTALEGRPALDKGTLEKVQDNALTATAADTAIEGAKPLSGTIALAGRAADVIPRNSYQGLSEKDRITIQTLDRGKQLLQHVMTGAGASLGEAKQKAEAFGWVPGETEASMKAKIAGAKALANQFIQQAATPSAAGTPVKPDAVIPPSSKGVPFTPSGVMKMKAITRDKNRTRKERDDATAYIRAAHAAGVD